MIFLKLFLKKKKKIKKIVKMFCFVMYAIRVSEDTLELDGFV